MHTKVGQLDINFREVNTQLIHGQSSDLLLCNYSERLSKTFKLQTRKSADCCCCLHSIFAGSSTRASLGVPSAQKRSQQVPLSGGSARELRVGVCAGAGTHLVGCCQGGRPPVRRRSPCAPALSGGSPVRGRCGHHLRVRAEWRRSDSTESMTVP